MSTRLMPLAGHLDALKSHFHGLAPYSSEGDDGSYDARNTDDDQREVGDVPRQEQFVEIAWRIIGMIIFVPLGSLLIYYDRLTRRIGRILAFSGGVAFVRIASGLGFLPVYH
ncbi:MAG: hypothetical protein WBF15_12550 [Candidatus Sulfotelmatobacter sp.]